MAGGKLIGLGAHRPRYVDIRSQEAVKLTRCIFSTSTGGAPCQGVGFENGWLNPAAIPCCRWEGTVGPCSGRH